MLESRFFFSSRRRHTRLTCDWSSDVCSSDLRVGERLRLCVRVPGGEQSPAGGGPSDPERDGPRGDRPLRGPIARAAVRAVPAAGLLAGPERIPRVRGHGIPAALAESRVKSRRILSSRPHRAVVLLKRGAEAELRRTEFLGRPAVEKYRTPKRYRLEALDEDLRRSRLRT